MAESRKRGGKKAHRKRIEKRNSILKSQQAAMQKLFNESLKRQLEELKKQYDSQSGQTENVE